MNDSDTVEVRLTHQEWLIVRAGVLKLPGEVCIPVLMKLEPQLQPVPQPTLKEAAE